MVGDFEIHKEDNAENHRVKAERGLGRGRPQVDTRLSWALEVLGCWAIPHSRAWCLGSGRHPWS